MKPNPILFVVFFSLLCSCKEENVHNYQSEIDQLSTNVQQSEYLEKIYHLDQHIREEGSDLLQKTGENSLEYKNNRDSMMKLDVINLAKIETYLSKYGYPSLKNHSEDAALAPWLIIHHNPSVETSKKHFKTFYQAYKKGDIDGNAFTLYLGRFYSVVYGKRLDLLSPYTEEFEIDTLVKVLDLQELKNQIDKSL